MADCSPTDELKCKFVAEGMSCRLGTSTRPSVALLRWHIVAFDATFERQFQAAETHQLQDEHVTAALVNLHGWLGWLRAQECFGIEHDCVSVVPPAESASVDLPQGTGVVGANLQAQPKSDQTQTADVVIAHITRNGLSLGKWLERKFLLNPTKRSRDKLMSSKREKEWTSKHF